MVFKEGNIIAEHYELKKQLGQGSFGDVWLAHNILADIDVAIKFYGTLDQKGIEDFRNEFKIAYRLHHPNLLNISHFDVFENCPYLVMPFCENGSVSQRIGQMQESEIWKLVHDVSCGLAFLHNQNPPIVHQDIKPDNILITSDGRYVISDFGISRSFRTQMSRTNNKVNSSGTLAYMGPERFSEKPMIVLASDIWAFGMTLYEAISGDVLWEGMGGCVQLNGARIPTISGITPELTRLICACLSPETWNRPTAQQIYDYAAAKMQNKPLPPIPLPPQETPTQLPKEPERIESPELRHINSNTSPSVKPSKKHSAPSFPAFNTPSSKRILIATIALLCIVLIGIGAMFFHNSIKEEQDFVSCKTKEDFELFIKEHPSSSYISAAQKRIKALTPDNKEPETTTTEKSNSIQNSTKPIQITIKENGKASELPVTKQGQQADDRIFFQPSNNKQSRPTPSPSSKLNDDDVFYACQTIGDYQSYLNTFPAGRHRSQAQAAINNLLNRNDNTVNYDEPTSADINTRRAHQNLPPRNYRHKSPNRLRPGGNRPPRGGFRRHY